MSDCAPLQTSELANSVAGRSSLHRIVRRAVELFKCDTARITSPCGRHFLILGWNKNTKTERESGRDCGQWYRNGEPIDFNYVHEQVIANGATLAALWKSAKHYKRLLDASAPNAELTHRREQPTT